MTDVHDKKTRSYNMSRIRGIIIISDLISVANIFSMPQGKIEEMENGPKE
jgi:hypothetical protein